MASALIIRPCCKICEYCDAPDASVIKVITSGIVGPCGCTANAAEDRSIKFGTEPTLNPNGIWYLPRKSSCSWWIEHAEDTGSVADYGMPPAPNPDCSGEPNQDYRTLKLGIYLVITATKYEFKMRLTGNNATGVFYATDTHEGTMACTELVLTNALTACVYEYDTQNPLDTWWDSGYYDGAATLTWGAEA